MKLATIKYNDTVYSGIVKEEQFYAFEAIDPALPEDMTEFIEGYDQYKDIVGDKIDRAGATCNVTEAQFLSPIRRPRSFRDFLSFEEHTVNSAKAANYSDEVIEQVLQVWRSMPGFYFSNPNPFFGADEPVKNHPLSKMFDIEFEVGIIIGKEGADISKEDAKDYIFGLTVLNDWSARDIQMKEMALQLGPAKGKDYANSMGPVIVTMDELEQYICADDPFKYNMKTTLCRNGELLRENNLNTIYHTFSDLIVHASRSTSVYPGEVLGSGTIGGGAMLEYMGKQPFVQAGDVFEMTIEGIGTLRMEVTE